MGRCAKRGDGVAGHEGEESTAGGAKTGARWWIAAALLGLGVAGWAGLGRDRQRQVEGTVRTIGRGLQDASATVQGKFAAAQTSDRNVGLAQQITARLHGEMALDAEKIEVQVEHESTAILEELVPDAAAKEKAVALTRDTRGVLKVVDRLAVMPPVRVIDAPPADAIAAEPRRRDVR